MSEEKGYNGWANYATWLVRLELLDGLDRLGEPDSLYELAKALESYTEEAIEDSAQKGIAYSWARAFISGADWRELALAYADDNDLEYDEFGDLIETQGEDE